VLEHIENAKAFTQKLFAVGRNVLLSVPYLWPEGLCLSHRQDPVSYEKLHEWTGRTPVFSIIVRDNRCRRLIALYLERDACWPDFVDRLFGNETQTAKQLADLEQRYKRLKSSLSWKLTAPVRAIGRVLGLPKKK
jgi:hypothetical protein